jgi:hypothetical protein
MNYRCPIVMKVINKTLSATVTCLQMEKIGTCVTLIEESEARALPSNRLAEGGQTQAFNFKLMLQHLLLRGQLPRVLSVVKLEDHFFGNPQLKGDAAYVLLAPALQGSPRVTELDNQDSKRISVLDREVPARCHRIQEARKPRPD